MCVPREPEVVRLLRIMEEGYHEDWGHTLQLYNYIVLLCEILLHVGDV